MPLSYIILEHNETDADALNQIQTESGNLFPALNRVINFLRGAVMGARRMKVDVVTGMDKATGTVTLSSHVASNTVTVGKTTLTADTHYAVGGDDAATATALAAAINAHAVIGDIVRAEVDSSTEEQVNLTAKLPGLIGNEIPLAISANGSVSASYMASGTSGTERLHGYGSETANA